MVDTSATLTAGAAAALHVGANALRAGAAALAPAERTRAVCRDAARWCVARGWAVLPEVPLPCGRRLDLLAIDPGGCLIGLEVKSCARDFRADTKWPEYRAWCDRLYFAVDAEFPSGLIPDDVGLLIVAAGEGALVREGSTHALAAARRRALLLRAVRLAAGRLFAASDPDGAAALRSALLIE